MSSTNIVPSTQTTTSVVTSFSVNCVSLNLFNGATFSVNTFDVNNNLIKRQNLIMDQTTYNEWQSNDTFVINWVATQLNFVIQD